MAAKSSSVPVRVATDLYESARAVSSRSSRSVAQQVDYWARLGRAVSMVETAARTQVEEAVAGRVALSELSAEERMVANAEIDTAIEQRALATSFRETLAAEGLTTVGMDDEGRLVEFRPDGTSTVIE